MPLLQSLLKDFSLYKYHDPPEGVTLNTSCGQFFGHHGLFTVFSRVRTISLFSFWKRSQRAGLVAVYSYLMGRSRGGRAGLFLGTHREEAEAQWAKVEGKDIAVRYKN